MNTDEHQLKADKEKANNIKTALFIRHLTVFIGGR
jgi:hypothetical protein